MSGLPGEWHLPFEPSSGDMPDADKAALVDGVVVMAAKVPSALGVLPALVFRFSTGGRFDVPPVIFVTDAGGLRNVTALVADAARMAEASVT